MAKIPIGQKAVGDLIKLNVNGFPKKFIVINQGNPDTSIYDSSCDGTWVLMQDIYVKRQWDNMDNDYANSKIHEYLNQTFFPLLNSDVQSAVKQVKIPYINGKGNVGTVANGANGLSTKVFLLSYREVGSEYGQEGITLDYFNGATNDMRIAYYNGRALPWWSRSPLKNDESVYMIDYQGRVTGDYAMYKSETSVRPAFILPSDFEVSDGGGINGYSNIGGTNKELTGEGYVNIGGTLKPIAESYINIGGTLKSLS